MTNDEMRAIVAASDAATAMADAFRKAFGIRREPRPKRGKQEPDRSFYARMMNQRYGACDRMR